MPAQQDRYVEDIDFSALALQDRDFAKVLKPNGQVDFTDPASVKQLTTSVLRRDFGLGIQLPDDRLCPPVPNRFNYISWVQNLLDTTSQSFDDQYHENREVIGLDIGTGASCVFPLLGCSQRPSWRFIATGSNSQVLKLLDIDHKNLEFARKNVLLNNLKSRIKPVQTKPDEPLLQLDKFDLESIDFTMCNPPFYSSASELADLAKLKSRPPHSACTGAEVEMVTEGGEVAFVRRMIEESVSLGRRVQWYSSMLGRLSSMEQLVPLLEQHGIRNWAVTEFVQGSKTRRWGIAWSWSGIRPPSMLSRAVGALPKALMPFPPEHSIRFAEHEASTVANALNNLLGTLPEIRWQYKPTLSQGVGFANGNVWSRAARRGRTAPPLEDAEPALGFKIKLQDEGRESMLEVRWLVGFDSVLFESFCGMLRRKLVT